MSRDAEVVWLTEERIFAVLVNRGAYYSMVKYTRAGTDYEVQISNDDYEFYEDANDYERE